ncbi:MAG: hypothetical protein MR607_04735 [Lachnospiraceae bacterium]|nr:hypothetical protein [Lachnospiraceae bacterium]MDY6334764.1 hypothetical protein [Lachnospiraceae bacterium]
MGKIVYLTGSAENSLYDLLLLSHQTGKDQQNELFRKASSILYDSAALLKDAKPLPMPSLAEQVWVTTIGPVEIFFHEVPRYHRINILRINYPDAEL